MRIYGYLRASTKDQNALRAKEVLGDFAHNLKVKVSAWFIENESGAKLQRPELFRFLMPSAVCSMVYGERMEGPAEKLCFFIMDKILN